MQSRIILHMEYMVTRLRLNERGHVFSPGASGDQRRPTATPGTGRPAQACERSQKCILRICCDVLNLNDAVQLYPADQAWVHKSASHRHCRNVPPQRQHTQAAGHLNTRRSS